MVVSVAILVAAIREKKLAARIAEEYPEDEEADKGKEAAPGLCPGTFERALYSCWHPYSYGSPPINAVTTAYSRYGRGMGASRRKFCRLLMIAGAAAIVSYIPIGMIASAIGRKKTIIIGILMMSASYFCGFCL